MSTSRVYSVNINCRGEDERSDDKGAGESSSVGGTAMPIAGDVERVKKSERIVVGSKNAVPEAKRVQLRRPIVQELEGQQEEFVTRIQITTYRKRISNVTSAPREKGEKSPPSEVKSPKSQAKEDKLELGELEKAKPVKIGPNPKVSQEDKQIKKFVKEPERPHSTKQLSGERTDEDGKSDQRDGKLSSIEGTAMPMKDDLDVGNKYEKFVVISKSMSRSKSTQNSLTKDCKMSWENGEKSPSTEAKSAKSNAKEKLKSGGLINVIPVIEPMASVKEKSRYLNSVSQKDEQIKKSSKEPEKLQSTKKLIGSGKKIDEGGKLPLIEETAIPINDELDGANKDGKFVDGAKSVSRSEIRTNFSKKVTQKSSRSQENVEKLPPTEEISTTSKVKEDSPEFGELVNAIPCFVPTSSEKEKEKSSRSLSKQPKSASPKEEQMKIRVKDLAQKEQSMKKLSCIIEGGNHTDDGKLSLIEGTAMPISDDLEGVKLEKMFVVAAKSVRRSKITQTCWKKVSQASSATMKNEEKSPPTQEISLEGDKLEKITEVKEAKPCIGPTAAEKEKSSTSFNKQPKSVSPNEKEIKKSLKESEKPQLMEQLSEGGKSGTDEEKLSPIEGTAMPIMDDFDGVSKCEPLVRGPKRASEPKSVQLRGQIVPQLEIKEKFAGRSKITQTPQKKVSQVSSRPQEKEEKSPPTEERSLKSPIKDDIPEKLRELKKAKPCQVVSTLSEKEKPPIGKSVSQKDEQKSSKEPEKPQPMKKLMCFGKKSDEGGKRDADDGKLSSVEGTAMPIKDDFDGGNKREKIVVGSKSVSRSGITTLPKKVSHQPSESKENVEKSPPTEEKSSKSQAKEDKLELDELKKSQPPKLSSIILEKAKSPTSSSKQQKSASQKDEQIKKPLQELKSPRLLSIRETSTVCEKKDDSECSKMSESTVLSMANLSQENGEVCENDDYYYALINSSTFSGEVDRFCVFGDGYRCLICGFSVKREHLCAGHFGHQCRKL